MALLDTSSFTDPLVNGFYHIVPKLPGAIMALLAGVVIVRLLSWIIQAFLGLVRLPKGLRGILVSLIDSLLWVFLAIAVLQSLGLNNVAFVFSGSIAAVGLALAAGGSNLAADILAGIFLAQDRDFNLGDEVRAGDDKTEGIVESMDMRRTRVRASDGKLHVIPNSIIERKEWVVIATKKELK